MRRERLQMVWMRVILMKPILIQKKGWFCSYGYVMLKVGRLSQPTGSLHKRSAYVSGSTYKLQMHLVRLILEYRDDV